MRKIIAILIGTLLMMSASAQIYQKSGSKLILIQGLDTLTIDSTAKYTTALLQNIRGRVGASTNVGDSSLVWDALTRSIKMRLITSGGAYTGTFPIVVTGGVISVNDASSTNSGVLNTVTQSIGGEKTFTSNLNVDFNLRASGDFQQGTNAKGMKVKTISNYTGIWFDQATPDFTNYNFLYDYGIGKTVLNGPTGVSLRAGNDYNASVSIKSNKSLWVNNHEGLNEGEYLNEIFHVNGGSFNKLESPLQLGFGIKGALGQTEDLIRVVDSINLPLFKITGKGTAEFNNGILAKGSTMLRIEGAAGSLPIGSIGAGLEISNDRILRYNRSTAQFLPLEIAGSTINITGNLNVASLASGLTPPATTGTTRMAVFDANGLLSTEVKPSGGGTTFDSTSVSNRINVNSTNITTNTNNIALKWGLTGNAGTTNSNFLGTTDENPLYFRVYNDTIAKFGTNLGNTAIGYNNFATGMSSIAMGFVNRSSGDISTAIGQQNISTGAISTAIGNTLKAKYYSGFVIGSCNDSTLTGSSSTVNSLNRLFQIGNGTSNASRSNALTVLQNGYVGFGTVSPQGLLDLTSTTQGFLPPRMTTTQRNAIVTPGDGLQVFNKTTEQPNYYDSTAGAWKGFPSTPIYQQAAIPFANVSGVLTSDSTKLTYGGEYLNIATTSATGRSGIFLNQGRAEMYAQFGGLTFNIGSGTAIGTYDASKTYTFQNRGNTYLQMGTTAITGGVNNATFSANVSAQSITSTSTSKTAGYTVATLPAGTVGMTAYVTDAVSPTYLGTLTGGGTVVTPVFRNATQWVSH